MYWPHFPWALLLPSFWQAFTNIAKPAKDAAGLHANTACTWNNCFAPIDYAAMDELIGRTVRVQPNLKAKDPNPRHELTWGVKCGGMRR